MYDIGSLIVYGSTGVCRVKDITTPDFSEDRNRLYYVLDPLYQDGLIYTPVDTGVFMRPVISKEEAQRLIELIPTMTTQAYHERSVQRLAEHYKEAISTHDCADLIELAMSIYSKKLSAEMSGKKFGQVDERFLRRAETLLFGEMAAALDIPADQVQSYIAQKVENSAADN